MAIPNPGCPQPDAIELVSIRQAAERHPAFSENSLRNLVRQRRVNGLEPHVHKVGKRWLINLPGFVRWATERRAAQ